MVCMPFKNDLIKVCSLISKKAAYSPKRGHGTHHGIASDGHAVNIRHFATKVSCYRLHEIRTLLGHVR